MAARKGHWFLALVTFGAFTTEVLQVTMSALWTTQLGVLTRNINLKRDLELRTVSHIFQDSNTDAQAGIYYPFENVITNLYGGTSFYSSWIFSALIEIASGGSPPAWSKDGWGFPLVDLGNIGIYPSITNLIRRSTDPLESTLNITFDSPALLGRIECTAIHNSSQWVTFHENFTDPWRWNISRNPTNLTSGYELTSLVRFVGFTKASGETSPQNVSIGEWLFPGNEDLEDSKPPPNPGITVLWINGGYPQEFYDTYDDVSYIFAVPPEIQALSCVPVFESANARITVNIDGSVQHYELLEPPRNATGAWSDYFNIHYWNKTIYEHPTGQYFNETVR